MVCGASWMPWCTCENEFSDFGGIIYLIFYLFTTSFITILSWYFTTSKLGIFFFFLLQFIMWATLLYYIKLNFVTLFRSLHFIDTTELWDPKRSWPGLVRARISCQWEGSTWSHVCMQGDFQASCHQEETGGTHHQREESAILHSEQVHCAPVRLFSGPP